MSQLQSNCGPTPAPPPEFRVLQIATSRGLRSDIARCVCRNAGANRQVSAKLAIFDCCHRTEGIHSSLYLPRLTRLLVGSLHGVANASSDLRAPAVRWAVELWLDRGGSLSRLNAQT